MTGWATSSPCTGLLTQHAPPEFSHDRQTVDPGGGIRARRVHVAGLARETLGNLAVQLRRVVVVVQEVVQVMTAGGNTARVGTRGIVEGLSRAMELMSPEDCENVKQLLTKVINS